MTARVSLLVLVIFGLAAVAGTSVCYGEDFSNEPFESFRAIDAKLTLLDGQFAALKQCLAQREPQGSARGCLRETQDVRASLAAIERRSLKLRSHYRRRGQRLGYRLFSKLRTKAHATAGAVAGLKDAPTQYVRSRNLARVQKAMLATVLEFQAISGGYGAVHCDPTAWACGSLRRASRENRSEGVTWACVKQARACRGLLGPQTPDLAPQIVESTPRPTNSLQGKR